MKKNDKTWKNALGQDVPEVAISPFDKKKEKIMISTFKEADKLSKQLEKLKKELYSKFDALYAERLRSKGVESDDRKGNYTFFSYDKSIKVEMTIQENIAFSDSINIAQTKLNEYLDDELKSSNENLKLLVHNAFKTRKGRLDKARVLSLLAIHINHPKWNEAMELIKESIEVSNTKRYASVSIRDVEGQYKQIQLNFSSI